MSQALSTLGRPAGHLRLPLRLFRRLNPHFSRLVSETLAQAAPTAYAVIENVGGEVS